MSEKKVNKETGALAEEKAAKPKTKKAPVEAKAEVKAEETAGAEKPAKASKEKSAVKEKAESKTPKAKGESYVPRLRKLYETQAVKALMDTFKFKSSMAVPKLVKCIINVGAGDAVQDKAVLDPVVDEISLIAGQHAVKTYAKKSISNFHLREGMPIGVRVTLRGSRMYDFIDKLISIALPRVRDFKGLSRSSFDGRGNYSFSLREQLVFPEIDYDKIKKIRGMDITIVTTAKNDEEAYQLLRSIGFPVREK